MTNDLNVHESFSNKIEKARLYSTNYNVYIVSYNRLEGQKNFHETSINLSNKGLKSIEWSCRDSSRIFKPVTRKEEIIIVKHGGIDINLSWAKNDTDMMAFMIDQHIAYHGGMNLRDKLTTENKYNYENKLGMNLRTDLKKIGNAEKKVNITSNAITNFSRKETFRNPTYLTARFDLRINQQHYNGRVESYLIKNVAFKDFSQKTSEGGNEIEESMKAFGSSIMYSDTNTTSPSPDVYRIIHDNLYKQCQSKPDEHKLTWLDRKIINGNNLNIYNK